MTATDVRLVGQVDLGAHTLEMEEPLADLPAVLPVKDDAASSSSAGKAKPVTLDPTDVPAAQLEAAKRRITNALVREATKIRDAATEFIQSANPVNREEPADE